MYGKILFGNKAKADVRNYYISPDFPNHSAYFLHSPPIFYIKPIFPLQKKGGHPPQSFDKSSVLMMRREDLFWICSITDRLTFANSHMYGFTII